MNTRITGYQTLLLSQPRVIFKLPTVLHPSTQLSEQLKKTSHSCEEVLTYVTNVRPDLMDQPLKNPELVMVTDDSSFITDGTR